MAAAPAIGRATHVEPLVQTGDGDAAAVLYERYSDRVLRFCRYQLGSPEDAEDALQTTFLYAFRGLRRGVVPQAELPWLLTIAHNVCRTRRRSAARRGGFEVARDLHALEDVVAAPERNEEALADVAAVLAAMPARQRRAIVLREWHGCSYGEIARDLGLSGPAAESLIFRARRALAEGLREAGGRNGLRAIDLGSIAAAVKSAVGGVSAVKLAVAAVAIVTAGALATAPVFTARDTRSPRAPRPSSSDVARSSVPTVRPAASLALGQAFERKRAADSVAEDPSEGGTGGATATDDGGAETPAETGETLESTTDELLDTSETLLEPVTDGSLLDDVSTDDLPKLPDATTLPSTNDVVESLPDATAVLP